MLLSPINRRSYCSGRFADCSDGRKEKPAHLCEPITAVCKVEKSM
jgi:hypothetical protein